MIKDPVRKYSSSYSENAIQDHLGDHFAISKEPFFWIEDYAIGLTKEIRVAHWYINKHGVGAGATTMFIEPGKRGSTYQVTPEQMVEYLSINWPDHLEWLLWNPGWL